ncbi:MAG: hypothetical protein HFE39_09565 [Clostridiales bacterium]|jgi:hypothetical protein|nr:hypothetical protein [Clostridiales bacterium]
MTKLYRVLGMVCLACGVIAFVMLFMSQPLHGFLYGVLGIALGLALYEIGELRDRLRHVENTLHITEEISKEKEKQTCRVVMQANKK